jgi:Tfp pilus assembly protein PilN
MHQQVNLYQPMFREQKVVFSAMTMLQVGVFFLLVFAGLYAYEANQIKPYKKQLASIANELSQLNVQVDALSSLKKRDKSKLLEREIAKLSKELKQRERISKILNNRSFGNSQGFSSYLEAFARGHVEGTWLTSIDIKQGGAFLGLKGKTLSSELVPVYIQNLAEEKSLDGFVFNVMELARVETEERKSELNFLISTN